MKQSKHALLCKNFARFVARLRQEILQLKERVTRQDNRLTELERQLNDVLSWKRKVESVSGEFQALERKVEEIARVCEERNEETSRKADQALKECAKQHDREELAGDLAHLKENEKETATKSPTKTESAKYNYWQNLHQ